MKNCITKLLSSSVLICCFWSYSKEDTGATYNKTCITGYLSPESAIIKEQVFKNKFYEH